MRPGDPILAEMFDSLNRISPDDPIYRGLKDFCSLIQNACAKFKSSRGRQARERKSFCDELMAVAADLFKGAAEIKTSQATTRELTGDCECDPKIMIASALKLIKDSLTDLAEEQAATTAVLLAAQHSLLATLGGVRAGALERADTIEKAPPAKGFGPTQRTGDADRLSRILERKQITVEGWAQSHNSGGRRSLIGAHGAAASRWGRSGCLGISTRPLSISARRVCAWDQLRVFRD
jgi:hypothetical protein